MKLKKSSLETYQSSFPDIIKQVGDYLKLIVSKDSLDTLTTSTGTFATLIKVFSKPIIDTVFKQIESKQLEDYGLNIYIESSIELANECLTKILEDEEVQFIEGITEDLNKDVITESIRRQIDIHSVNTVLIFQPRFHPIVVLIKNIYSDILKRQIVNDEINNKFLKMFNTNISEKIKANFGGNYYKHLEEVKASHLSEKEAEILHEAIQNARIGFDENESLNYVESFAQWEEVSKIDISINRILLDKEELSKTESSLIEAKELIRTYFESDSEATIEKILFLIADFGKGKSVFLKNYASQLAKEYLLNSEGYIPIYFNLRDFSRYHSDSRNGVIYDFIETKYGVKLDDQYFKSKRYIFLVDSLDESGELTKQSVDKVVNSIKRIQNIDKEHCRENRIVVTSRPFDEGLKNHLLSHQPFQKTGDNGKPQPLFISLYGFKKDQFNQWLSSMLIKNEAFLNGARSTYSIKIISSLKESSVVDLYDTLSKDETLSYEELKRPIFGYMIYQLLINDYDFSKVGKIGVYLSFINLLSKEAKYIHDKDYSFSLTEQFECRNILHSVASLWAHERVLGRQGSLKKADICRAMEADIINPNDEKVLAKYKGEGINEISFLSHSYFGENDNVLHFQHQSFAEILLAEYYLKVLIKFSLDRTVNYNLARKKLFVGQPSAQTLDFFKGLLMLFRETCSDVINDDILEKRKLLFPFISSIALEKYNKELSSETLFFKWFENFNWNKSISEPPKTLLTNWFFNREHITKIADLCQEILEDDSYELIISNSSNETAIFNNELTKLRSEDLNIRHLDKLICLFAGNILLNDSSNDQYFMRRFSPISSEVILNQLLNKNFKIFKAFKTNCFRGTIIKSDNVFDASNLDLENVDFANSHFSNVTFKYLNLFNTNFRNSTFYNVDFSRADIYSTDFEDCKFMGVANFALSIIGQGVFFPYSLASRIFDLTSPPEFEEDNLDIEFIGIYTCFGDNKSVIRSEYYKPGTDYLNSFKQIIQAFIKKNTITMEEVLDGFYFDKSDNLEYTNNIEDLLEYLNC
ncbi:pentapeptide repeat-containing protein [Mucilaginibacter lacusdianchii]|uniref:pentapeptide repeat-containing protein n=1 Tax=Mucilaginibacter lacusdianchii TaxID=2684211 RepID=UPI00131DF92A|nr:pentapeptide repeat-containing protein [Mucilaginibacter sp. JXJ CY 39]